MACYIGVAKRPDINTADAALLYDELVETENIGDTIALRILSSRPFDDWDDLETRVEGIGEIRLKHLKCRFNLRT